MQSSNSLLLTARRVFRSQSSRFEVLAGVRSERCRLPRRVLQMRAIVKIFIVALFLKWTFDAAREGRVVSDSGVDEQLVVFVLASGKAQGRQNAESQRNNVES